MTMLSRFYGDVKKEIFPKNTRYSDAISANTEAARISMAASHASMRAAAGVIIAFGELAAQSTREKKKRV